MLMGKKLGIQVPAKLARIETRICYGEKQVRDSLQGKGMRFLS